MDDGQLEKEHQRDRQLDNTHWGAEVTRLDVEIRSIRHRLDTGEQKDIYVATLLDQLVKDIGRLQDTLYGKLGIEVAVELLKHQAEHERVAKLTRGQTIGLWSAVVFGIIGAVLSAISTWAAVALRG